MEQGERPYELSCKTEHRRVAGGTETAAAVLSLPDNVDARTAQPAVAVLYQDAVDGHAVGDVLVLQNGQTAGGTAFAVTGPHTVQLTLRGSAVVLLGLGGLALAAWLLFRKRKK